jgi:hypothetical protein
MCDIKGLAFSSIIEAILSLFKPTYKLSVAIKKKAHTTFLILTFIFYIA